MNKLIFASAFLLFSLTFIACDEEDLTNPVIELSAPANGDIFNIDQTIELIGRASDNDALRSLNIESDLGELQGNTITDFNDPSDFPFNINIKIDSITPPGDYFIRLTATDLSGNAAELTRNIVIE